MLLIYFSLIFFNLQADWSWCNEGIEAAKSDLFITNQCYNVAVRAYNESKIDKDTFSSILQRKIEAEGYYKDGYARCQTKIFTDVTYAGDRFSWVKRACQAACGIEDNPNGTCYFSNPYKEANQFIPSDQEFEEKIKNRKRYESEFNNNQNPELIFSKAGVTPGMTVAEIGVGAGRVAVPLAQTVGPNGFLYALDLEPLFIFEYRMKKICLNNYVSAYGIDTGELSENEKRVNIPAVVLDRVFLVDTLHHIKDPDIVLTSIKKSMKQDAKLIIVEPNKNWKKIGCRLLSPEELLQLLDETGYILIKKETLPTKKSDYYEFKML